MKHEKILKCEIFLTLKSLKQQGSNLGFKSTHETRDKGTREQEQEQEKGNMNQIFMYVD